MIPYKNAMLGLVLGALLIPGSPVWAGSPEKDPKFQKNHPRQTEVLKRTDRERARINNLYKEGKISAQERDRLQSEAKSVRQEDFADAKANSKTGTVRGGYITKDQQRVMNQQENQLNQQIRQDAGK